MDIRRADASQWEAMAQLRALLWPDTSPADHLAELRDTAGQDDVVAFVATLPSGGISGFAEASIRRDYVNGCDTSPVAFLEGVYVGEHYRRQGVATALCTAVAQWGVAKGCSELGSDAEIDNVGSHALHAHLGFEERERIVCFRRLI